MTRRASMFLARWAKSDRPRFRPDQRVVTGECPADWPADIRLPEEASGAVALFADLARRLAGPPATQILTTDPVLAHGLAGLARCLEVELPGAAVQVLLLDPVSAEQMQTLAETAPDEVLLDARGLRSGAQAVARRFEPEDHGTAAAAAWEPKGHVVLTGGNGAIAHLLARSFSHRATGLTGLTLIGRAASSAASLALLADLRGGGCAAEWLADPGEASALAEALHRRRALAGPVTAVFHTAGLRADALLAGAQLPALAPVLRAKLGLAQDLDAATRADPLEVFAGFSSLATVCGNEGQGGYAFANGLMDGFFAARQAQGGRGQSVSFNWGYWAEGGMRLSPETLDALRARDGLEPIPTGEAMAALLRGVICAAPQVAVACGAEGQIRARLNRPAGGATAPSRAQIRNANPELAHLVALRLRAVLAEAGGRSPDEIDPQEPFASYGVDSLMIVAVLARLRPVFGELPRAVMFEHATVTRMAQWLAQTHPAAAAGWTGVTPAAAPLPAAPLPAAALPPVVQPQTAAPAAAPEAEEVVIVGMAGQFPDAPDLATLWQNLTRGHDAITEVPPDRWDMTALFDPDPRRAREGFSYARWGGFLAGFADFDPGFFAMTPREAIETDPQERLFLATAWHALEDAGLTPERLQQRLAGAVGVFAGVTKSDHSRLGPRRHADGSLVHPRASFSSVANRVSFALDLRGPSVPVDTMCSASLTALHQAREALLRGECALALAGGVNLYQHPSSYAELCQSGMLAQDGRCRSFGAGATGFVPGEGVACLVLTTRRLARDLALRVEAVLRATAVNHGGAANGYTQPNPAAQRALVETVVEAAGCLARDIGYVEAHGTGTALGDPIEVESLTAAFAALGGGAAGGCDLGSIKSNIGHLEAAAGCTGVLKAVLQLRHGEIVPSLHSARPNPDIDFSRTPFHLVQSRKPWTGPRRALVNSFGAGGANACALIEAEPEEEAAPHQAAPDLLLLSAKSRAALLRQVGRLRDWLAARPCAPVPGLRGVLAARLGLGVEDIPAEASLAELGLTVEDLRWLALETGTEGLTPDRRLSSLARPEGAGSAVNLQALCFTLQTGRAALPVRLALPVASITEAEAALQAVLADPEACGIVEIPRSARSDLDRLAAHPEVARQIAALLASRDLTRLAGLWRRGLGIDWAALHPLPPKPLSLPGYPFEARRLWLGDLPLAQAEVQPVAAPVVAPVSAPDHAALTAALRLVLCQTMDIGAEEIDPATSFADYGLDSILGIRFVDAVNRAFGSTLKTTAIFDHPTLHRLALHLHETGASPVAAPVPPPVAAPAAPKPVTRPQDGPIAIIGQSGRYPDAPDLETFWQNLLTGHRAVRPVSRWPLPETVRCRRGGFLADIDQFDAPFFNISGAEARYMDPQQRLLLEQSWQALEQAGYVGAAAAGLRCGVYIGCYTGDYQDLFTAAPSAQSLWGNMGSVIPARIAYHLDLRGPALAFDTACSSSLVAVDAACKALARGEVEMAVAGGVFLQVTPRLYLAADRAGMLSPTGESWSFDARADGFVPGEGVGVVVLKRLADAQAAGDTILATIAGSAVNSNGKTNGLIAPSSRAQADLLRDCLAAADASPADVGLIEAHGTGTALGDPIEVAALGEVFGAAASPPASAPLALTSVKPAIGHAQFAAGIASLHKVVMALETGVIPANLCFDQANPRLDLAASGFAVPRDNINWPQGRARLAGVSSFGASGTNAHVLLRAAPPRAAGLYGAQSYPVLLSARSAPALRAMAADLAAWCEAHPEVALGDVAYTLSAGRMHFEQRCGFAARSLADLVAQLRAWLAGQSLPVASYAEMLAAFVAGAAPPPWHSLFPADRPRRIALPGAVFERQSCWVDAALPLEAPTFALRPLEGRSFAIEITAQSPLLRDHQVQGAPVLPGLALPEMIRQALSRIEGDEVTTLTIRDLCWLRPIDLAALPDLRLGIGAEVPGEGARVSFTSGGAELARARVLRGAFDLLPLVGAQDALPVPLAGIGAKLRAGGIVHGPAMQALSTLARAGTKAFAGLALRFGPVEPLSPALLDSAVQAAVVFAEGAAATMPFAVDEITLHLPAAARMSARLDAPRASASGGLAGLDIDLLLPDGRVAIALRGVTARPIPAAASVAPEPGTTHAFLPRWAQVACDAAAATAPPEVVFHPEGGTVPAELWPAVPRAGLSDVTGWGGADRIALWVSGQPANPVTAEKTLLSQVLALIQTVLAAGGEARPVGWTVLSQLAQHLPGATSTGYGAALPGLFGALGREYPSWTVRLADIDRLDGVNPDGLPDRRVLLRRDGLWLEQSLHRLAALPSAAPPYRAGAVYVVIGGAGGVARAWAGHVLGQCAAQIVWLGRSPPGAEIAAHQDRLAALGPRPVYLQADARDGAALAAARAEILARFGRIDGVVHSAITLADGGLAGMDGARMDAALSAKLDTLANMMAVFGADMRDFGLVFSSLQSFARMPGQANYAAACTHADSFALEQASRRGLPLRLVNWGYWAEAGIVATEDHRRRMQRFGLLGLHPGRAFAALDALICGGPAQMAIAELQTGASVAMEWQAPEAAMTLIGAPAPAVLAGLDLPDAVDRWRPIHARLGAQMDRFDAEMTDVLAASVAAAGLLQPEARAGVRGLPGIFDRWWQESARVLRAAGYLSAEGRPARPCPELGAALGRWQAVSAACADDPDLRDHLRLAGAMLRALPDILAGRRPATEAMFPEGRFDLVNGVYHGNSVADFFNDLLADAVEAAVRARIALDPQVRLRLVEVGAGTGGTARGLVRRLAPYAANIGEYLFTDLSKAFLISARQGLGPAAPYLQTRLFDVSKPPQIQGLEAGSYDIAVATNVLHATRDILQSLAHTKALLRPNGLILVNELTRKSLFSHLTFGLLEGWWAYDDTALRLPGTPALAASRWPLVLSLAGFRQGTPLCPEAEVLCQQVFIGQSDGAIGSGAQAVESPEVQITAPAEPVPAEPVPVAPASFDLRAHLRARLSDAIEVDAARIEDEAAFERYGVDSILVLQIVDALRPAFPKLTSTVLFECNCIAALAEHLAARHPEAVARLAAASAPVPVAAPSPAPLPAPVPAPVAAPQRSSSRDVAVIGLAGQFAQCGDVEALCAAVQAGQTLFGPAPQEGRHWPAQDLRPAGFMADADRFDPLFFAISPAEAVQMDPQERIFLQTAYHAMENAGLAPQALSRQGRVAVLAGVMNAHYPTRAAFWSVANRLSFLFDFKGPSLSCDTACSSSATALVLAMDLLRAGRCEVAIAGGVNVIAHPRHLDTLSGLGIQSRQGRILPFSAEADGMLSGEGAGVAVLKRLDRALADGDRIEAVLRGGAMASGGRSSSYTAPSPAAQAAVIAQALADAGAAPEQITLVEAHGTGTRLGDPIEIEGLRRALPGGTRCAVSSVKANIGHAESAAAMAGLFKIIGQMRQGTIAPLPDLARINPEIDLSESGLHFPRVAEPWPRRAGQERLAGLSSFGAGGANAHLIVAEPPVEAVLPEIAGPFVVPLSARSPGQVRTLAANLLRHIENTPALRLADLAFTLQTGRDALPVRWACVAAGIEDLTLALRDFLAGAAAAPADPMARDWLTGAAVDWAAGWVGRAARRLALPLYPFAEESFWLAETTPEPAAEIPTKAAPPAAPRVSALEVLCDAVGETLGLAPERLDLDAPLDGYGLDSVRILRVTERLEAVFGPLPKTLFYEHRSLNALAAHLGDSLPAAPQPEVMPAPQPAPPEDPVPEGAIAIIGLAGRYPQAETLESFWQVLASGRDCITPVPAARWDHGRFFSPSRSPGKTRSRWGGFLDGVDLFDAAFFGILPKDADLSDPQERLFVETAWHALEDAGHCPESLAAQGRVGVFVGVMYSEYQLLGAAETALGRPTALSASPASIANRVSYLFDFQGPSLAVDTMCASSLTAIHLAVRALRAGECRAAIAGGVNLTLHPNKYLMMAHGGFEATDGRCRSFGAGGTGYVPAEGVGAVVLKPLARALAEGDQILAVIRGSAVNHGGRTNGYTVPDPVAQASTIRAALADGRVAAEAISYLECHGTGTALGDPVEIAGLKQVFGATQPLALGSVKSNIGHCESAAGVAGLTKVILQMRHRQRVPSLHSATLNPDLGIAGTGFSVDQGLAPWTGPGGRLLAGVSSFGAGGSNAHLILEEPPALAKAAPEPGPFALILSARTPGQIAQMASDLADHLARGGPSLAEVAFTLQTGRRAQPVRAGILAETPEAAMAALRLVAQGTPPEVTGPSPAAQLLRRWLAGDRVDWTALYANPPRRVRLPLYPFARKSFWGVPLAAASALPVAEPAPPPADLGSPPADLGSPPGELALFRPVWSRDERPADAAERLAERLIVDLTGTLPERAGACLAFAPMLPEDLAAALVARLAPVMAQARLPRLIQFALPADAGALLPAVAAFAGTMAQERRSLATQVLHLALPLAPGDLERILTQQAAMAAAVIRLSPEGRFVRHLARLDLPAERLAPPEGLVVISGGLGGLGRIFAADIAAAHPDTPILLLGRRGRDADVQALLAQIGARRLAYQPVDITDPVAVSAAIDFARAEFGPVAMVIHAAGILRDGMLMVKTAADARAVVAVKTAGARALDLATRHDPLSAFVLCSSLAGVTGNLGQADYAFANGWLDGFAAARQGPGRGLSLNWPLWAEGGMTVPAPALAAMREGYGLWPMPAAAGCRALWHGLGGAAPQVLVAFGAPARIAETLDGGSANRGAVAEAEPEVDAAPLAADLAKLVAQVLRLPPEEVQLDTELADYGFDSIALVKLAEDATQRLGLPVSPSLFYRFATLRQLARHLASEGASRSTPALAAPPVIATPQASDPDQAVAVVGMSGAFPGAADIAGFWRSLTEGRAVISEIPPERWDWRALLGDPKTQPGKTDIRWGGFLADIAGFDPLFFGISPREAEMMDPHQRLLLTHAWRAIEDAGLAPSALSGSNTSVFMATSASEYAAMAREAGLVLQQQSSSGSVGSLGPNRISHFLNLCGPSEPVETACSSALVALHRAVESIRAGCDGALVGAVNTMLMPHAHISFARSGMLSPDGTCRSFAADANGYVRSEGVAVLLLRRLGDARREGLPIHGVIRATGVNHGGRAISLFAPNAPAQARLVAAVLRASGLDPATVTAIEAHGTGTPVGDPIEIEGLKQGFRTAVAQFGGAGPEPGQIAVSSVKSWIGHCEVAAGMAGLIKLLLQMRHGVLIPDAHRADVNPALGLAGTPFRLVDRLTPWTPPRSAEGAMIPRRAGISSFGFGGVNAHAVIEEAPAPSAAPRATSGPEVIVLSAQSAKALAATAAALLDWVQAQEVAPRLDSLAATLQSGRNGLRHRLAFVAASVEDLRRGLAAVVAGRGAEASVIIGVARGQAEPEAAGPEGAPERTPAQMASDWVAGRALRWPERAAGLPRLALPSTAMDMRRCWFDSAALPVAGGESAVGPILGPPRLLSLSAQTGPGAAVYTALFGADAVFVREHQVQGAAVLPGAAYAAMVQEAAADHFGTAALSIRDLSFERMARGADLSPPLRLALTEEGAQGASFRIDSAAGLHARGRVGPCGGPPRHLDLAALRVKVTTQLEGAAFYDVFARMGLAYGPGFRLIERAEAGAGVVIARIRQIWPGQSAAARLALPPNLLDAALQATLGFTLLRGAGQSDLMVPVGINQIDMFGPLGSEVVPELVLVAQQAPETAGRLSDIAICAPDGTVLVDLRGFVAARVGPLRTSSAPPDPAPKGRDRAAQRALVQHLREAVAGLARVDLAEVDAAAALDDFGLDALALDALAADLGQTLGRAIAPAEVFGNPSLAALAARLAAEPEAPTLASTPPSAPAEPERAALQAAVVQRVAALVHLAPSDLTEDTAFAEIGVDSITFAELASQLSTLLRLEISPAALYECATVGALWARFLPLAAAPVAPPPLVAPPVLAPVLAPVPEQPVPQPLPAQPILPAQEGFAIIGMSGAFPGAPDPEALWQNMLVGRDVITRPPEWRWDWTRIDGDPRLSPGRTNIHWGGFIEGLADFDPAFFGLSGAEAEIMDPQQRLMMMHVWSALESAGYAPRSLAGSKTGLYMGVASASYAMMVGRAGRSTDPRWVMGNVVSMGLNRISHMLDLHGPSEPCETACSSSLVALHRGIEDLRSGICDMILAGGVNAMPNEDLHIAFSAAGMLSPEGRCKTFDKEANGYVRGEGIGVVVVRRLQDALREGNEILGVIRATGVRHAGRAVSLTAPNPQSQAALICEVLGRAGVAPASLSFIEAHGTGTALGDPIEIEGLKSAFEAGAGQVPLRPGFCAIGAVKTHVGHLEMAAGVTGLIKVLLQMRHRQIVGNLHCQTVNPLLRLEGSPFRLAQVTEPWAPRDADGLPMPLRAGISSFGFGGVNAHVVLDGPPEPPQDREPDLAPQAILLSAASETALRAQAARLCDWIAARPGALSEPGLLARIAVTLQDGRDAFAHRLALVVRDPGQLAEALRAWGEGLPLPGGVALRLGQSRGKAAFLRAEEVSLLAAQWARGRDLDRACEAWVEGTPIDWQAFRLLPARRVSLPSYPFDCKHYWVGKPVTAGAAPAPPSAPVAAEDGLEATLRRIAAEYRGLPPEAIALDAALSELGFDSIGIMTVVSRLTAAMPELKLAEKADRLLQVASLRALLTIAEGDAPASGAEKAETLHLDLYVQRQKKDPGNIVIARPVLHLGKAPRSSARLGIDETHPLFFDHPLDHVSGLHLAEAICQLGRATELCQHHRDPRASVFLQQLRFDFPALCGKQAAEVFVRPDPAGAHGYRGEVRQAGAVVANGLMVFGTLEGLVPPPEGAPGQGTARRIRRARVNKSNAENVLLAGLETDGKQLRASLSLDPKAGFYNDFVGPAQDGIVVLEAVRQVMRAIATKDTGAGKDTGSGKDRLGLLRQMEVTLDRPVWRGEAVEFVANTEGSMVVGGAALLAVQGEIFAPGGAERIGRFATSATQITQELHRAWSQQLTGKRD